ncbi:Repeat domain-containing protein [Tenacibaculum sp. MAR_2009_124]|uniref:FG-GAP repeat domain-containing protein n=1 Tax=Tenacibaculum sp. MAR_2009_124 TaxID=1250059 RepID=UPI0008948BFC|nr:VCBS repeat-containing protein [Tenacibaculum sp. MAR_2009_124]SEB42724.1 Repeat domain-containing protein [Tenacibaculum sp. MAR_2009_124]
MKKTFIPVLSILISCFSCSTEEELLTNQNTHTETTNSEGKSHLGRGIHGFSSLSDFTYAQGWRVKYKVTEKIKVGEDCKWVTRGAPPYEFRVFECEDIFETQTFYKGHPRELRDVNGDGKADIIGFGEHDVWVSLSNGSNFEQTKSWNKHFNNSHDGWMTNKHVRSVADVNGDGKADIVGFGENEVRVALSNGSSFAPYTVWTHDFTYTNSNWRVEKHVRKLADVNGDGKADIIGFGENEVRVSLSNGNSFGPYTVWNQHFAYNNSGWRVERHARTVADVNGDGKADIIGFGENEVRVALSNGSSFGSYRVWSTHFAYNNSGWRVDKHVRIVTDVNGDGKDDIVGFGENEIRVSLSNGSYFQPYTVLSSDYSYNSGWRNDKHVRTVADVDGDGKADIVGFGDSQVLVKLSEY